MRAGLTFLAVWVALIIALVVALLIGSGTLAFGQTTVETSGTHYFPGAIQTGPTVFTSLGKAQYKCTATQNLGVWVYCKDCQGCDAVCTQTSDPNLQGAYAACIGGEWTCFGRGSICASGGACVQPGGACTTSCQCCEGACMNGICVDTITCSDIGTTCNICPSMSACNLTSTIPPSTTSTSTSTTTTSTGASTTTGTGSTTSSTTTTTLAFSSFGLLYTNNLVAGAADVYGAGGKTATTPPGTPVLMPVFGHFSHVPPQALRFSCIADQTPQATDPTCNNSSIACPLWTMCLAQSNAPFDETNFTDTIACCSMNSVFPACTASNATITFFTGQLLTFHAHYTAGGGGGGGTGPTHMRCTQEIGP